MNVHFHPDAEREIEDALAWYDGMSQRLGDEFLKELEQSLDRIRNFPEAWAIFSTNTRRCRLQKFPYGIVYRLVPDDIQVIAVMHLHRKPDYWAERIEAAVPDNRKQHG